MRIIYEKILMLTVILFSINAIAQEAVEFTPQATMYTLPIVSVNMPNMDTEEQFNVSLENGSLLIATKSGKQDYKATEIYLLKGENTAKLKWSDKLKAYTLDLEKAKLNESDIKEYNIIVEKKLKTDKAISKDLSKLSLVQIFNIETGSPKEICYTVSTKIKKETNEYVLKHIYDNGNYFEYITDEKPLAVFNRYGIAINNKDDATQAVAEKDMPPSTIYTLPYLSYDMPDMNSISKLDVSFNGGMLIVATESGKQDYKKDEINIYNETTNQSLKLEWNSKTKAYMCGFENYYLTKEEIIKEFNIYTLSSAKNDKNISKDLVKRNIVSFFNIETGALTKRMYNVALNKDKTEFLIYSLTRLFGSDGYYDYAINDNKIARYNKDGIRLAVEKPIIPSTVADIKAMPNIDLIKKYEFEIKLPLVTDNMQINMDNSYWPKFYLKFETGTRAYTLNYNAETKTNVIDISAGVFKEFYAERFIADAALLGIPVVSDYGISAVKNIDKKTSLNFDISLKENSDIVDFYLNKTFANSKDEYNGEEHYLIKVSTAPACVVKNDLGDTLLVVEKKDEGILVKFYDSIGNFVEEKLYK